MRSIARLFGAFGALGDALHGLAGVIDAASAKLRLQLASEIDVPPLGHNGEVIDNGAESASTPRRNGKKPTTTA